MAKSAGIHLVLIQRESDDFFLAGLIIRTAGGPFVQY